jgi:peroxidase
MIRKYYSKDAGGIDSILLSLINEPVSAFDTNFPDFLQNHLFEFKQLDQSIQAVDLASINIMRGRDHGIQSYNFVREKCGFKKATNFQDFSDFINQDNIDELSLIYEYLNSLFIINNN